MRILVSGGAGFIGRNLSARLLADGHEVAITATRHDDVRFDGPVIYAGADGLDLRRLRRTPFDVLFHLAANNDTLYMDLREMYRANVRASVSLFEAVYAGGCRKIVYASSTAVYGAEAAPYVESESRVCPINPYAVSKAILERRAARFSASHGVPVIGLRYCNVYGPGEQDKGQRMSMVGKMIRLFRDGYRIRLFEDGSQRRDWVYVDDVVQANVLAMGSGATDVYNIGSGVSTRFDDLAVLIAGLLNPIPVVLHEHVEWVENPFPERYQAHTECCIEKARRGLSYGPLYDVRSGVLRYLVSLSETGETSGVAIRKNLSRSESYRRPGR